MKSSWMKRAACVGQQDLFFCPDNEESEHRIVRESRAKAICWPCPVRLRCLDYALRRDERYGVWGATNPGDRAHIRRTRQRVFEGQLSLVPA